MKLHRFLGNFNLNSERFEIADKEFLHQVKSVLKLRAGEKIILGDGKNNEVLAEIENFKPKMAILKIIERRKNENEPDIDVILYCSILKKDNFETVMQKATECGVKEIIPLLCQRTVKQSFKKERLEKIIKEAAEQSGRGIIPVLQNPINFKDTIKQTDDNDCNFLFDISGETNSSFRSSQCPFRAGLWIGPEGGWTEKEIEEARRNKFRIINLGKLTLRAETAAVVATYLASTKILW